MPLVINTNVSSLNSQRQMMTSGKELDQAMERLSSGKRINSAGDDAAGLSIANRFTSQIRGLDQAVRNANDGISLIQTAEGALDESTNILQRMRELAIQSSNGIYSDTDRATLDAEVQQLVQELDRIAETTSFNGQNILDGTLGNVDLQVGAEANQTISFSIQEMNTQSLGLGSTSADLSGDRIQDLTNLNTNVAGDNLNAVVTFAEGDILINDQSLAAFDGSTGTLQDIINDINTNVNGVTASGFNVIQAGSVGDGTLAADEVLTISVFNPSDSSETEFTFSNSASLQDLVDDVNTKTGGIVDASINDNGRLVLSNDTGAAIALSLDDGLGGTATLSGVLGISNTNVTDNGGSIGAATEFAAAADYGVLFAGQLALSSDDGSDLSIRTGANGTATDLSNLGFRETSSGQVTGVALSTAAQATALDAGDISINGTAIASTTVAEGLQGKVDNINDVTATTGVVANVSASQSYSYDASITPVEIIASDAYAAPADASYTEVHFADSAVPSGFASLAGDVTFQVDSDLANDVVVTLEANQGTSVGSDITAANFTLSGTTDTFTIDDGAGASSTITLVAGDYFTGEGLAAYVQGAIDDEASTSVTVTYDTDHLVFTSNIVGTSSAITIGAVGGSVLATLGMAAPTETTGVDLINDAAGLVTAINTDLVAGGSSAEAYIDANSKLAFRETETGTGNGPLDINTMAVSNSTSDNANVNALMGFDFAQTSTGASSYAGAAAGFSLNGTDISLALAQVDGSVSAVEIADAVNTASATTGVTAYVDDADKLHFASDEAFTLADDTNASGFVAGLDTGANLNAGALSTAATSGSLKINGFEVGSISLTDVDAAATTINAAQANTGVTATIDDNGELQLSGNSTITLEAGQANGIASGRVLGVNFTDGSTPDGLLDAQTVNASIELTSINSSSPISLEINGNGATATGLKDLNTDLGATVTGSALSSISVGSAAGAQNAIESIDVALETINSTRSDLGAINNRLDFTVSNLSNVSENASAARSRIMDADFASETAALSRSQVLQQASQAMLAQANARPQQVLSLLN